VVVVLLVVVVVVVLVVVFSCGYCVFINCISQSKGRG
jgi:hypothetical protein